LSCCDSFVIQKEPILANSLAFLFIITATQSSYPD